MLQEGGKKIIILCILQILRKYTDENHTMTQQQIADKLLSDYGLEVSRSTVKRNVTDLIDAEYNVQYRPIARTHTDKKTGETEENIIYTDLYYEHEITQSQLRMLIDGLLFSRSVPHSARKELIESLCELSSIHFNKRMSKVHCLSADSPQNPELFLNIELLDEAIEKGKQVEITYGQYGTDLKLHKARNGDGSEKRQVLNPYQLVANEGRYYLICNNDKYDSVANYRIDRMMNIRLLETSAKPKNRVEGLGDRLDLQEYVFQNLNMFSSRPENVEFVIQKNYVSLIIDFFGKHVSFHEQGDGTVSCRLKISGTAMKHWAVEHANIAKVVSPPALVEEIREEIRKAAELYDMKI